jgi:hypothetical protein
MESSLSAVSASINTPSTSYFSSEVANFQLLQRVTANSGVTVDVSE